jgi:hypothetical protein
MALLKARSAIEQIWARMKAWLSKLPTPSNILKELEEKIYEAWEAVCTPEVCRKLFDSMANRLNSCIKNNGARINK